MRLCVNEQSAQAEATKRAVDPEPLHLTGVLIAIHLSQRNTTCGNAVDEGEQQADVACGQAF